MRARSHHFSISVILIFAVLLSSCTGINGTSGNGTGQEGTPILAATYTLPLLPIQIAYDFLSKKISVSISGRIQTPIGTFGISTGLGVAEKKFGGVRTLIVEAGDKRYVYKLEKGRPYRISLPSDENGKTEVNYPGDDENLIITIPNPTDETIADLKEKLKEEQEAHERDKAQSQAQSEGQGTTGESGNGTGEVAPTPTPKQELTTEQCRQLVAQYNPDQFLYVPPECQDMLEAYKRHLQEQEYARKQRQREEENERERREEIRQREAEESARRKQQQIEQWGNVIGNIIRRRRP